MKKKICVIYIYFIITVKIIKISTNTNQYFNLSHMSNQYKTNASSYSTNTETNKRPKLDAYGNPWDSNGSYIDSYGSRNNVSVGTGNYSGNCNSYSGSCGFYSSSIVPNA